MAALVLLALSAVHLPSVRNRALEYARNYVSRELGVQLRASDLSYSLLSRSVELRDVSLRAAAADQPFLQVNRAVVVLDRGIFLGRVSVTHISLTTPVLTVVRNGDGTVNLPSPSPSAPATQRAPLRLGTISLAAFSVRIEDRLERRSVVFGPIDLSLDTAATAGRSGSFGPASFAVQAGSVRTAGTVAGRLGFDGTRVRFDGFKIDTREAQVTFDGWADVIGERPVMSSQVAATIDVAQAARLARVDTAGITGRLTARLGIAGPTANPAITVTGTVASSAGSVELDGTVDTADAPGANRVAVRWTNLDVDQLARAFSDRMPLRVASRASGSATMAFRLADLASRAWSNLSVDATTALVPRAGATTGERLGLAGSVDMHVARGEWSVRHTIRLPRHDSDLVGRVTGRVLGEEQATIRSTLAGRVSVRAADLGVLPPLLAAAGLRITPELENGWYGAMDATVDLDGTLESPRATIDLGVRGLRAARLPAPADVHAILTADKSGMRATDVRATSGSSSLHGSGRYGWRGAVDGKFEWIAGDLAEIASFAGSPVPVEGSATLAGTVSGRTTALHAVASATARALTIEQVEIGTLTANATLDLSNGGLLQIDAAAPAAGARATVEVVNRAGYPVSGEISIARPDIAGLVPQRYRDRIGDLSGLVHATARGAGQLTDLASFQGRVDIPAVDLTWRGTRVALASAGSVSISDDGLAADGLDLLIGQETRATVAGQLSAASTGRSLQLHLHGPLAELIDIGARTAGAAPEDLRAVGTATLDLAVSGTLAHPLPTGHFTIRSPSVVYGSLPALTDLSVDASIDPALVTLRTFTARWQGASFKGEGALPWRVILTSQPTRFAKWLQALPQEPARATMTLSADHVTQAVLGGLIAPGQLDAVQGDVSAKAMIEASRLDLPGIRATAILERASVALNGVAFTQDVPTRVVLQDGRARIEDFRWRAADNPFVASGSINLAATPVSIELGVSGAVDLRVLGAFINDARPAGRADTTFTLKGTLDDPAIAGRIHISDAELQWDSPRIAASDLEGVLEIGSGRKLSIAMVGSVNTGTATLDGIIDMAVFARPNGSLQLTARNVVLEYPSGLQTESNADLDFTLDGDRSAVSGRIDVLGGAYREPLVFSTQFRSLSAATAVAGSPAPDWMSRLGLDVSISTATDVRVDNNYGRLDVGGTLRLTGTAANPGVVGRVEAADNGEIYIGGNTYQVERLAVDFANPRAIAPELMFSAETRIGELPIGIDLHCPADRPCERKVLSLDSNVDDKEAEARLLGSVGTTTAAGETLARLLSGELLGVIGRTVGLDALRLERVTERRDIFDDPTLISGDVNPAARLTLAKRVGSNVELVFSQNLADDGFTWSTTYLARYGMSGRLLILDDQSRAYEFRHEPPLGGARPRRPPRPPGPRVTVIRFVGAPGFPEDQLRRQLRLREGDRFAFGAWQQDRDRLERFYHSRDLLEARIRSRRLAGESPEQGVVLEYDITRGPVTRVDVRGATLPDPVRKRLSDRWATALFDGFLERDARTIVRDHLYREGHLDAGVTASMSHDASRDIKTLTLEVVPGATMTGRIEVTGNSRLPSGPMLDAVHNADPFAPWLDPGSVERLLEDHCRSEGFLDARVSVRAAEHRNGASIVTIVVHEGAPYALGHVALSGVPPELASESRELLTFTSGDRYRPAVVAASAGRLELRMHDAAYRQSRVEVGTRVDPTAARVDLDVAVTAGPRSILRDVIVEGADPTKPIVARSIVLPVGSPLDTAALVETRRRLYDLGIYRSVDVDIQPVPGQPDAQAEQPVAARIVVEERPRYRLRYGLAVNDDVTGPDEREQRLGFAADLENRNIFGRGASAKLALRLRQDQQVGRFSVGAKRFLGLPIRSTVFIERAREQLSSDATSRTTASTSTFAGEQAYRIRPGMELRYGYGFERNHTFIRSEQIDAFDVTVNIARFTTSGLVDRRDDAFNPARGWFTASTLELSAPAIGSYLSFLKYFAQVSDFIPLDRGMVIASGLRVGLAHTAEDVLLIPTERFYAGGANSVRGYREDDLGARSSLGDAEGGSALLVMNGELRFPMFKRLRGVGFLDAGNVYPSIGDISARKLQVGTGGGARLDTPFGLLRFDVGFPVNRRPTDPRWRFHFGLGHAF